MRGVLAATAAAVLMVAPAATSAESEATAAGPICGGHASAAAPGPAKPAQSLLEGYGSGGFRIQTSNPKAQAYFDNGMQLGHAFAHKASIAAFQEARRLDPTCGMCAWGEAWSRGPTINYPIDGKEQAELAKIADRAAQLAADGPDKERRLTAALQLRYRHGGGKGSGDIAFAKAMESLAHQHPDDNELAILAAARLAAGESAEAERQARAVLAHTPDDPLTLLVLARAEKALGRTVEAGETLSKARSLWRGPLPEEIAVV